MVELDEVDLAKALTMLSKLLARTAADIVIELDSPERTHELAGVLEQTARLLRERAMDTPPKIIDSPIVGGAAVSEKHAPGAAIVGPACFPWPHPPRCRRIRMLRACAMGNVDPENIEGLTVAWGRSVLEPTRGHVREMHEGHPVTHDVSGAVVGMALCGALLIDDLAPDIAAGEFDKCSACLELLHEVRRGDADRVPTQGPSD